MGFRTGLHPLGGGINDPYKKETVLFESATPGTYNIEILGKGKYEVYCIAAGGGGLSYILHAGSNRKPKITQTAGGSGSGFIGTVVLDKGFYLLTVGAGGNRIESNGTAGTGGNSSIANSVVAFGGTGGKMLGNGNGGQNSQVTVKVISTRLNSPGNGGTGGCSGASSSTAAYGGASVYNGYGAGGGHRSNGTNGYIKIIYKG